MWHWAHKSKISCDPWWENETEWHRTWKNNFPQDWQEIIHKDSTTGERHVADIKTDKGFVIEFQHSAIKPDEIKSREDFYKNMVWVIDGTRLKRDHARFYKGFRGLTSLNNTGFFLSTSPEACFPASWLTSLVPVYFDFQGIAPINQTDSKLADFWCLFPRHEDGHNVIACVSRKQFIELSSTTPHLLQAQEVLSNIAQFSRQERAITPQ
ncbi:MAG: competence protein [Elusimicrobiota bacterium]